MKTTPKIVETLRAVCPPLKGYQSDTIVNYELWDQSIVEGKNITECFYLHDAAFFPEKATYYNKSGSYSARVEIIRDENQTNPFAQISVMKGPKAFTVVDRVKRNYDDDYQLIPQNRLSPEQTSKYQCVRNVMVDALAQMSMQTENPRFKEYCLLFGVSKEDLEVYQPVVEQPAPNPEMGI